MRILRNVQARYVVIFSLVLIGSIALIVFTYRITLLPRPTQTSQARLTPTSLIGNTPTVISTPATPSPSPSPPTPALNPGTVLGISGSPPSLYPGIHWTRIGYKTCGSNLTGNTLKTAIQNNHSQGVHVLLLICQVPGAHLLDKKPLQDIAQSGADAIECGNEQMKHNPYPTYLSPVDFARFFDLCERTVHAVSPGIPTLLGSLDPHVGGVDYGPLYDQLNYLDEMESAMNSTVHPGGHWSWRAQSVGLIDSWHNGYPSQYVNSLQALFQFWAKQFRVDLNSGGLGKHLWVVEGTGCYYGCGINPNSSYEVAVSHILTLITDVQTTLQYKVPFFYFSLKDFYFTAAGNIAPFGVLDVNGHPKPIRQDLPRGARSLTMSCSNRQTVVVDQEQLLVKLYQGCSLPGNYLSILTS
jgi:hypothetical protein